MNFLIAVALLCFSDARAGDARVKKLPVVNDQIVTVKTAMGIATIIQVPDRPNSVVVGDMEAFKVEYLDQAITIKPLLAGARSNLYVYTDYQRYNVQLVTGAENAADYVVYLKYPNKTEEEKEASKPTTVWKPFDSHFKNEALTLEVTRLGQTKEVALVQFRILSTKKETLKPEWIWVTQKGVSKPINRLFFTKLEVLPNHPVQGFIQVLRKDIDLKEPLRIELRREKISYLTVPGVNAW